VNLNKDDFERLKRLTHFVNNWEAKAIPIEDVLISVRGGKLLFIMGETDNNLTHARGVASFVLSPKTAKSLMLLLNDRIRRYEREHGPISVPPIDFPGSEDL